MELWGYIGAAVCMGIAAIGSAIGIELPDREQSELGNVVISITSRLHSF